MTRIKICGLTRPADIEAVNAARPEYAGFVFAPGKRRVDLETACRLKQLLDPGIRAVGVFVDEDPQTVAAICAAGAIDIVQLHGSEGEDYIRSIRTLAGCPVIKAIRVRDASDILAAERLDCDYLLLDTYSAAAAGGTGRSFDWTLPAPRGREFFLAGGLDSSNVLQAIGMMRPFAVDVSSGVETDGRKDPEKIRVFVETVRRYDSGGQEDAKGGEG